MAAVTESIGFGVTASTTYEQPYAMARESSTVESIEQWTSGLEYPRNFGLDTQVEHDERYDIAHEYLDVTYKLWEGSLER
ncbi:hypothetical protein ACEPPN_001378 [Leptodophora sp. 'Broadleaf-Isolate-01']